MVLSAQHVWDKVTIWMNSIAYFCVLGIVRHAWKTMWILKTFVRLFGLFFSTVAGYVIHILIRLKRVKVISIECEQNVTMLSMLVERINWPILDTIPHTWMCETQSVNVFVGHGIITKPYVTIMGWLIYSKSYPTLYLLGNCYIITCEDQRECEDLFIAWICWFPEIISPAVQVQCIACVIRHTEPY